MKKLFVLVLMLCLVSALAIAQNENNNGPNEEAQGQENMPAAAQTEVIAYKQGEPELYAEGEQNQEMNKAMAAEENKQQVQTGLMNALGNVENENAKQNIQKNMEQFMEKYQARIEKMEKVDVTIDEDAEVTQIKAKERVKYLGFIKGKATNKFQIENNGEVTEKKPWYRFLYKEGVVEEPAA